MVKKLLFVLSFILVIASAVAEEKQHLVKPGDTLYSLSKKYGVTVEAIQAANPSVVGTNIAAGMTLIIPEPEASAQSAVAAVVSAKEPTDDKALQFTDPKDRKQSSLLGIFRKKGKDEAKEQPKKAEAPVEVVHGQVVAAQPVHVEEPVKQDKRVKSYGAPSNIAVIMPFRLDAQTSGDDRQQMRAVEFYEGFMLAVDEAQQKGQKILIQTYDLGTKTMAEILATKSLLDADLIIAPMEAEEVKVVADFGRENDVPVLSAFAYNPEWSKNNRQLIQLNTSKYGLYDILTADLVKRFSDYDFVFINDSAFAKKADPYAAYLKKELKARNINSYDFTFGNPERLASIDSTLNIVHHNILYIPVVNDREAMRRMFPCLKCTTFDAETGQKEGQTAILGYPEWVLYTGDFMDYYYDMNVYMFSKFYVNPFEESVKKFNADFRYWYAKEQMPLTPRYGTMGYDIGKFFLAAIRHHGFSLTDNLVGYQMPTLQSMMNFVHDGQGFVNKGLYLVHFTPATQIEKYEIK